MEITLGCRSRREEIDDSLSVQSPRTTVELIIKVKQDDDDGSGQLNWIRTLQNAHIHEILSNNNFSNDHLRLSK